MSVRVQLEGRDASFYTNLDFITGRVTLNLTNDATITAVKVKLEAESRTRLSGPKYPGYGRDEKTAARLEVHKLLYKVQTVFPNQQIISQSSPDTQFTLRAGSYDYPFRLKFPFNNDCTVNTSLFKELNIGQLSMQLAPETGRHVKKTLPPSLGGFGGEADIRYYVKVTVVRPKFYQENLRAQRTINFLPIEPPRPSMSEEETYARRSHQFQAFQSTSRKKSIFSKMSKTPDDTESPLAIAVDARLPNPAIITCNKPLPLRILLENRSDSSATIYLSTLQVELLGYTQIRAQDMSRTVTSNWIIMSQANMNIPIVPPTDKTQEWVIPSHYWDQIPLHNTVAPSFETCNISRKYELEVRVGLSHGVGDEVRPEMPVLPLRLPVQVYSGVAPPAALLSRLSTRQTTKMTTGNLTPATPTYKPRPVVPQSSPSSANQDIPLPVRVGSLSLEPVFDDPNDLPPSYEDAMADDLAPVDGPRPVYMTQGDPQSSPSRSTFPRDEKSADGLARHPSERLFAQNAPRAPGWFRGKRNFSTPEQSNSIPLSEEPESEEVSPLVVNTVPQTSQTIARKPVGASAGVRHSSMSSVTSPTSTDQTESEAPPLPDRKGTGASITKREV